MHFNVAPCETLPSDRTFTKASPIFKVGFAGCPEKLTSAIDVLIVEWAKANTAMQTVLSLATVSIV